MQVIEAQRASILVSHDHLHINHVRWFSVHRGLINLQASLAIMAMDAQDGRNADDVKSARRAAVRHSLPAREAIHEPDRNTIGVLPPAGVAEAAFHEPRRLTVVQDAAAWLTIQRMP
jgi:hypothetical protein